MSITRKETEPGFGARLQRGRALRGLSLRELSAMLGGAVSHTALQKYEKGEMKPGSQTVLAIAEALQLRVDFFFGPHSVTIDGIEFRKRSTLGAKKQRQVVEAAREFLERYIEIERILGIRPAALRRTDLRNTARGALLDAAEAAAASVRKEWKLGTGPLPNTLELLEDHGVKAMELEVDDPRFDGLAGWAGSHPVILLASRLNSDLPRKRLTALHELGHLAMQMPEGIEKGVEEAACFRFAAALLLPKEALVGELGAKRAFPKVSMQELVSLKEQWGISIGALMRRAKDVGIVSEAAYRTFCIRASQGGLRASEPGTWSGRETSGRYRQLVHRASAQELITRAKAAGLLDVTLRQFDEQFEAPITSGA